MAKNLKSAVKNTISEVEKSQSLFENDLNVKMIDPLTLVEHPKNEEIFNNIEGKKYEDLKESIKSFGVLEPAIVRKVEGKYQILSGHQRTRVAVDLNLKEIPCRVMELDDIEAQLVLINTNTKNRELTQMELARAVKIEQELIKEKGGVKGKTIAHVAKSMDISTRKAEMLHKLNDLIPELQKLVDNDEIATGKAYEIAKLDKDTQQILYNTMKNGLEKIKLEEMKDMRNSLESENETLKKKLQEQDKQIKEKEQQLDSTNEEYSKLIEEYSKAKADDKTEEELQKLKGELEGKKSELEKAKGELEKAKAVNVEEIKKDIEKAKNEEIERLKKEKEALEKEKESAEKQAKEKADKVAKEKIEEITKKNKKKLEDERKAMQAEIEKMKKEIEETKASETQEEFNNAMQLELIASMKGTKQLMDNAVVQLDDCIQDLIENGGENGLNDECKKEFEQLMEAVRNFDMLKEHFE